MVETLDSNKQKIGPKDALRLLHGMKKLVCIMRGKNVFAYDLTMDRPDNETLLSQMIGPSGNLRAPAVRVGSTLVVGYNEDAYRRLLSS